MIRCEAGDVECTPNFFSITFVNLSDYLLKFKDCVNEKGKAIPITSKYSVKDIKEKLDSIESKSFWISDFDDSQLLELVSYLEGMRAKYIDKVDKDGVTYKEAYRTDFYGYNILGYDNLMIAAFLMYFNRFDNTKALCRHLYEISQKIISLQKDDKDAYFKDPTVEFLRKYKLPYASVDIMKVFALNKAGVLIDKDTGERKAYPKSLKQTSINLQWHELLEFRLPIITDEERKYYKNDKYNDLSNEQLTKLISSFDRCIISDYIPPMMYYNKNDVFIVCEAVRQKSSEIKLRYSISKSYNIDVLSSARSNVADKLFEKFYSYNTGLHPSAFNKLKTERTKISFNKVILPHIKFKTKQLQDFLNDIKTVVITRTTKDEFSRELDFYGTKYTIATGGIHSVDPPRICKSNDNFVYVHHDYTSYYPSIMIEYGICPAHLNKTAFVKTLSFIKNTRVAAKHGGDVEVIKGIPNEIVAEALKIVINSVYGKLGFAMGWLYDRFAQMQVTINGQLMTMSLIEELELNGIHCISANTDGIVIKLPLDKREVYDKICKEWNSYNKMSADDEEYEVIASRDVNNYLDKQKSGKIEYKGSFDPKQYIKDLTKGYDMPIVAEAVAKYFLDNIPIMDTLRNSTNILDFCKTQNVGKNFELEYVHVKNGEVLYDNIQRNTRFYIGLRGGSLEKVSIDGTRSRLAAGQKCIPLNSLDDVPIEMRNIDYKYYYNECFKLINPIMLGISPKGKGRTRARKYGGMYNPLFDFDD